MRSRSSPAAAAAEGEVTDAASADAGLFAPLASGIVAAFAGTAVYAVLWRVATERSVE